MKIEKDSLVYDGYFKIKKYDVKNSKNMSFEKECFEKTESVAALVYDSDNDELIFVKQYRIGAKNELLEIVAGSMDKEGESPYDTLKRELLEEIGVEIFENNYNYYGSLYVSPGCCNEKVHLYIVNKIIKHKNQGGGVDDEEIEIVKIKSKELIENVRNGTIKFNDMKTSFMVNIFIANLNHFLMSR
jgi:ADP-ribose pyrophosphatase